MKTDNDNDAEPKAATDFLHRSVNLCVCADCGLSAALVHAYIRDWISYNEKNKVKQAFFDNRYWVYRTHEQIYDGLGHVIGRDTIPKLTRKLVKCGYLIQDDFNRIRCKRTNWYAIGRSPDEPPADDPTAKSHEVVETLKDSREKRDAEKKRKAQARKEAKIERLKERREEFIDELLNANYTGTTADKEYGDEYGCSIMRFTDLNRKDRREVIEDYVDHCIRKGDTPNFNNFIHPEMQRIYACRYGQLLGLD